MAKRSRARSRRPRRIIRRRRYVRRRRAVPRSMSRKLHTVRYSQMVPFFYARINSGTRALNTYMQNNIGNATAYYLSFTLGDAATSSGVANPFWSAFQMYKLHCVVVVATPNFTVNQIAPVTGFATSLNNTQDNYSLVSPDPSTHTNIGSSSNPAVVTQYEGVSRHKWNAVITRKVYPKFALPILNQNGFIGTQATVCQKTPWSLSSNIAEMSGVSFIFPGLAATNTSTNYWDVTLKLYFRARGLI
jgi:hypothetical protein